MVPGLSYWTFGNSDRGRENSAAQEMPSQHVTHSFSRRSEAVSNS
jgi:hypothetical protein